MKKLFYLVIFLLIIISSNVYATSGQLRKDSIKTCPNGVTYGKHSDHWHVALVNEDGKYFASGSPINSDPCPRTNDNKGTAKETNKENETTKKTTSIYHKTTTASRTSTTKHTTTTTNIVTTTNMETTTTTTSTSKIIYTTTNNSINEESQLNNIFNVFLIINN